jgi:hypothetical protein
MQAIIWINTPPSKLKAGSIRFKWIEETFLTPPNDGDKEVLRR